LPSSTPSNLLVHDQNLIHNNPFPIKVYVLLAQNFLSFAIENHAKHIQLRRLKPANSLENSNVASKVSSEWQYK